MIRPGGDPAQLRLEIEGATPSIDRDGRMWAGPVVQWQPRAYQEDAGSRRAVAVELVPVGRTGFSFRVGDYRRDLPLIIDPVVEWAERIGGEDEDIVVFAVNYDRNSNAFGAYGITRSASWSGSGRPGNWDVFARGDTATYFWGGSGDEFIGSVVSENITRIVGWTNSRDALLVSGSQYAGGAYDAFVLDFAFGELRATLFGGPGDDRFLGIVSRSGPNSPERTFLIAGETDNPEWPGSVVRRRIGGGGGVDAILARLDSQQGLDLTVIGGSGSDRATAVRAETPVWGAGPRRWVVAGESDSPDFPAGAGPRAAKGVDAWLAFVDQPSADVQEASLVLWGGTLDERVRSLVWIREIGVYTAGVTNSPDLPGAASGFRGGATDGFVAWFDPDSLAPRKANYLGGEGRDEISALAADGADLYAGGSTDSRNLELPGLSGEPAGGSDALFVLCDFDTSPRTAYRNGGPGDDRVWHVQARSVGTATLAGATASADWLRRTVSPAGGGSDGFVAGIAFPNLRLTRDSGGDQPVTEVTIGKDLSQLLYLQAYAEPGMDRIVYVRSTDPAKVRISGGSGPGRSELLIPDAARGPVGIWVEALEAEGEASIVIEGRAAGSPYGVYPRRVLRVRLAPSRLFWTDPSERRVPLGEVVELGLTAAPVLAGGQPGLRQGLRQGLQPQLTLQISDPAALVLTNPTAELGNSFVLRLLRRGEYTVRAVSGTLPSPPETVVIRSGATPQLDGRRFALPKDHISQQSLTGWPGDSLLFTSEAPDLLRVGPTPAAAGASIEYRFPQPGSQDLWFVADSATGQARVRIEGTYRGEPVAGSFLVQLSPYTMTLAVGSRLAAGSTSGLGISVNRAAAPDGFEPVGFLPSAVRARVRVRSTDPRVASISPAFNPGEFWITTGGLGVATIEAEPESPEELQPRSTVVEVVPASIDFGTPELLAPQGGGSAVTLRTAFVPFGAAQLRIRVPEGSPFLLQYSSDPPRSEIAVPPRGDISFVVIAPPGSEGRSGSVLVSAPWLDERAIPVRSVGAVLAPWRTLFQLHRVEGVTRVPLSYTLRAYDRGNLVRLSYAWTLTARSTFRARLRATPAGLCEVPAFVELREGSWTGIEAECRGSGAVTVVAEAETGLHPDQSRFPVRIEIEDPPVRPRFPNRRLLAGRGLQNRLYLQDDSVFFGTVTSSDPARVRLSLDPARPGEASINSTATNGKELYVQALASEGIVVLRFEDVNGRRGEVPVYLFPSTLAVRAERTVPGTPLEVGLTDGSLTLRVAPAPYDPDTGRLFEDEARSIRGGTDPFFARLESSDTAVAAADPPTAVFSEGNATRDMRVAVRGLGTTEFRVPPVGDFSDVPDARLRLRVIERSIRIEWGAPVLSRDLQRRVQLRPVGGASGIASVVTVTSLEPAKLLLSTSETSTGAASLTLAPGSATFVLQAQSTADLGDRLRVRIASPGYATSEEVIEIVPAELQLDSPARRLSPFPEPQTGLSLRYGPILLNRGGELDRTFAGGWRPGVTRRLRVTSADPTALEITRPDIPLETGSRVEVRTLRPGRVDVRVEAPPDIVNRVESVPLEIDPWQFTVTAGPAARGLVSRLVLRNPSGRPVDASVSVVEGVPAVLGTAPSGPGAPGSLSLGVSVPARGEREIYAEIGSAQGFTTLLEFRAPDFRTERTGFTVRDPVVRFGAAGPVTANLAGGGVDVDLRLSGENGGDMTLGSVRSPLRVEVRSSNPNVVEGGSVEFVTGESRKVLRLPLRGRGDALLSVAPIPGFAPAAGPLVIAVR